MFTIVFLTIIGHELVLLKSSSHGRSVRWLCLWASPPLGCSTAFTGYTDHSNRFDSKLFLTCAGCGAKRGREIFYPAKMKHIAKGEADLHRLPSKRHHKSRRMPEEKWLCFDLTPRLCSISQIASNTQNHCPVLLSMSLFLAVVRESNCCDAGGRKSGTDRSDSTSGSCARGREASIGVFNAPSPFSGGNREQEQLQIMSFWKVMGTIILLSIKSEVAQCC